MFSFVATLPTLTQGQHDVLLNLISFAVAALGAAALFFFIAPGVSKKYKTAMVVSGLVCAIATYHYVQIFGNFKASYGLTESGYAATGVPFNDFYRYADWFITVPLLMVELIAVLALARAVAVPLFIKLTVASALMIGLGYPGEISSNVGVRWLWWSLSMVPFLYILYVLFTQLSASLDRQPAEVRSLVSVARMVVLVTWMFYPIAYLLNTIGLGAAGFVGVQAGYTIADVTAKAGFGLVIYAIARAKTAADEQKLEVSNQQESTGGNRMAELTGSNA